jgi:hypothetical protein
MRWAGLLALRDLQLSRHRPQAQPPPRPNVQARAQARAAAFAAAAGWHGGDDEGEDCCVCMERAVATKFEPCGHHVTCAVCAPTVRTKGSGCPICRADIERISAWAPP